MSREQQERQEVLEDEWLVVRHSGEIPEIALHSALYYLTDDPEGPGLTLSTDELQFLREAATERFGEIILRDLNYDHVHLRIYRGLKRVVYNWSRFQAFCKRQEVDSGPLREQAAAELRRKLTLVQAEQEVESPFFNCTCAELSTLLKDLDLAELQLPSALVCLCLPDD
ncbi:MAG: hypothetical protein H8E79_00135 [Desulfobulbaceae bacterium]|uniref:Uncharacterized protein n=1 Tax=Candidatus Desulfatifera sulfidica TaxID=2841691 RepID=A0A8J6N8E5_9BACT|nr:hypothetical protein [Candidatus Desulfatifera sulfidica]